MVRCFFARAERPSVGYSGHNRNFVQEVSIVHRNLHKLTNIKMFIVGVTGGIATGKSTVCEVFKEYGIPVIDADVAARKGS